MPTSPTRRPIPAARPAVVAVCLLVAGVAPAQSPDALARQRLHAFELRAERDVLDWEKQSAPPAAGPGGGPAAGRLNSDTILGKAKLDLTNLGQSYDDWKKALDAVAKKARERAVAARADWTVVYAARAAFQARVDRQEEQYGFDFAARAQAPFRPRAIDLVFLLLGVSAVFAGVALAGRVERVGVRRRSRARRAVAPAVALLVVALAQPGCDAPKPAGGQGWADREAAAATAEQERLQDGLAELRADRKTGGDRGIAAWAGLLPDVPAGKHPFAAYEADIRDRVVKLLIDARLAELLAAEAAAERARLPADESALAGLAAGARGQHTYGAVARVGAAVLVVGLAAVPVFLARRRHRRFLTQQARVCPRCLAAGTLAVRRSDAQDSRYPEPVYLECPDCSYRFRRSYQHVPRLCFPTVGIRSSGKTHMLTTVYDRVQNGAVPTRAPVQRVPPLGDDQFELFRQQIVGAQVGPRPTLNYLPEPIILEVRDLDRLGPSPVLTNLFDYSGELMTNRVDTDLLRRRALLMDGFMLFLDPTQLYARGNDLGLDDQIRALTEFHDDMREMRRVPVGRPIPVPIAVCISKFDLLVSDNPIRYQAVPFIRRLLTELSPPGPVSMAVLRARSDLVEGMLPLIFPGLNLRQRLADFFGGQVLFFPLSSVGLAEGELGQKDMRRRGYAPFGVVEPVLWLLHMHGYCVFGDGRPAGKGGG